MGSSTPTQSHPGTEEFFALDSEVEATIAKLRKLAKICFGSGKKRTYFPEDFGISKFGQVNNPNGDPTLPPRKLKSPRVEKFKPISTKGYGIGGLSGPARHYPQHHNPAPNHYDIRDDHVYSGREHHFPPQVWINYGLVQPNAEVKHHLPSQRINHKLTTLWNKCQQDRAPFGSSMRLPRFGRDPTWTLVGPGHYDIRKFDKQHVMVTNSFGMGPVGLNPPTKIHCAYGPKDSCVECGKELMKTEDYYRARYRTRLPAPTEPPVHRNTHEELTLLDWKKEAIADEERPKRKRVLLCRQCHCKALRGESRYWKKRKDVEWLFQKARHCGYIHEHNGLPDFTEKTSCYWVKRLQRKEAVLAKFYKDQCEKRIIMRNQEGK